MKWLLWKDYRHNRLIVLAALVILLVPYLIGLGVICGGRWVKTCQAVYWTPPWKQIIAVAGGYSLAISQLSLALIGGNAISGERVDRSAEFLYSLPIARRRLLASKLLLALAVSAVGWLVNGAVLGCLIAMYMPHVMNLEICNLTIFMGAMTIAITGLTFFCVAWFLSSYVKSPAFDVCGGFITPFLVLSSLSLVGWLLKIAGLSENAFEEGGEYWYLGICLALSLVSFAIGTWHYLRRVEP